MRALKPDYHNRELMIYHLVRNYQLMQLPYRDVVELPGEPDGIIRSDSVQVYYDIELKMFD